MTEKQQEPIRVTRKLIYLADHGRRLRYIHVFSDGRIHLEKRDHAASSEGYSHFSLEELRAALEQEGFILREDTQL